MSETMAENKTFTIQSGDQLYEHLVGDKNCKEGWCGGGHYPVKCKCGGLIHAEFGDEDTDCNYWLNLACDKCGDKYEEVE